MYPACPVKCEAYFSGVVKIFDFLGFEPRLNIKYGFNWAGKIEHFSKVSSSVGPHFPLFSSLLLAVHVIEQGVSYLSTFLLDHAPDSSKSSSYCINQ